MQQTTEFSRRSFIGTSLAACGMSALASPVFAGQNLRVKMKNAHTDEKFDYYIVENGQWVREALSQFDWFARDWRETETYPIATKTLHALIELQKRLDVQEPFILLSGYRTPRTNKSLRGAAKNSLHMRGQALDIRHEHRSTRQIHRALVSLKAGGVGYYPDSGFVHMDCGRVRYWQG